MNTATDSWITAIVNYADMLHQLVQQGDPTGEVARVAENIEQVLGKEGETS